jgi:phosphoribosylformimino-5-aminoimidazole carboxamide ribotide isomerase
MKDFVIPSIDLLDGKIVRLYQGNYNQSTVYNVDIDKLLEKYGNFENLHIVDLNDARGNGLVNIDLIKQIHSKFKGKIQLGGGIRSIEIANKILNEIKIDRIVLGTIAIVDFDLTKKIIEKFGKERIVLAIDCQFEDSKYTPKTNGWLENSNQKQGLFEILAQYVNLVKYILVTDISVDGTMQGANLDLYKQIKQKFPELTIQASGGVSSLSDLEKLQEIVNFAIVGKALYEGLIDEVYAN